MTRILIIMDPPETVHPEKDTTFALGEAAIKLGMSVYYAQVENLFLAGEIPYIYSQPCRFIRDLNHPIQFEGKLEKTALDDFDIILMRKDPPYDMNYIIATHMLSLAKKARVINDPKGLREAPEKIYPLRFPGIFPPTLISRKIKELTAFAKNNTEVILKPVDGNGGRGIIKSSSRDTNFMSICEMISRQELEYVIIQKYLPEISIGDKRIILLDGKPVGAILRIPPANDNRANLHVGGVAVKADLTQKETALCETIGPALKADGLYFTGIDVIGDYITEINVTSPTGIQEIKEFDGTDIAEMFWKELH